MGTLTTSSDVINAAGSDWAIELSGTSADTLVVGGNLNLSATDSLDVTGSGTGPWLIATYAGTLTGAFDNITSGYTVDYSTSGQIKLTAGLSGDYNGNGTVDAGDYVLWRKTPLVYNGDPGYTIWRSNFGKPPGAGSGGDLDGTAAVPEPGALSLVFFALSSILITSNGIFRRRKS